MAERLFHSTVWLCWMLIFYQVGLIATKEISTRRHRPPQREEHLEYNFPSNFEDDQKNQRNSPRSHQPSQKLMLRNQDVSSRRGDLDLPLYKQSYPGLYTRGEQKEFAYEPTMRVTHQNGHHGKDGHLFLLQPDTSHIFRGVAHALHLENLV